MEPEMTSDCPFRGVVWQHPVRKQHHGYRNRPFQPHIGNLMPLSGPEMTTFRNDTGPFSRSHELMVEGGLPATWDQEGAIPEMHSTEAILTSDCPFRGGIWQHPIGKQHPDFRNRQFQPPIGMKAPDSGLEMTTFHNDAGQFSRNKVLGHVSGESRRKRHGGGPGDPPPEAGRRGASQEPWRGQMPEISGEKCTAGEFVNNLEELNLS